MILSVRYGFDNNPNKTEGCKKKQYFSTLLGTKILPNE